MPLPRELRFELRPRRSRAVRLGTLLVVLIAVAGSLGTWLAPQVRKRFATHDAAFSERAVAASAAVASASLEAMSLPGVDYSGSTQVLDERLREAEQCVIGGATLHRFTYDGAERVATMHVELTDSQELGVLLSCLNANATGSGRWKFLSYESAAAGGGERIERSGRVVLTYSSR